MEIGRVQQISINLYLIQITLIYTDYFFIVIPSISMYIHQSQPISRITEFILSNFSFSTDL